MTLLRTDTFTTISLVAVAAIAGVACSGDDAGTGGGGGGGEVSDPAADACEHMEGGPFVDLTATADASGAPDASAEHTAHRITLAGDATAGFTGYVSYVVGQAGELGFFTDENVTMTLQDAAGAELAWEDECTSGCTDACSLVSNARTVDIATVGTYALRIESSTQGEVTLVVVHGGDHEHE